MEVFIVVAIIWIISEVCKESIQGTVFDKNANEVRDAMRQIERNFENKKNR